MPPGCHKTSDSDLESIISLQDISKPRRNSTGPKYFCTIAGCGESFKRLDHLDRHEYRHTNIKKHACSYEGCGKTYSILTHLKRHLRTTHERTAPPEKDVRCAVDTCTKLFSSVCNMQRHVREVHENPKLYHCSHCDEQFTHKLKMRRHVITKHTQEYPFRCSKCSKGFYQAWQYERHFANCKTYPCASCDQTFEKWTLYLKHCKEEQHQRTFYKCDHCQNSFVKPGELQKHIASKHTKDIPQMTYECSHDGCNRTYTYERNLRQHVLTSHGGKRFECEAPGCDCVFSSAQNLFKHVEREHNRKREGSGDDGAAHTKPKKAKKGRRKRKDAGKSLISNLAKCSSLAVSKDFDELLRNRDEDALMAVAATLDESGKESSLEEDLAAIVSEKAPEVIVPTCAYAQEREIDAAFF